MKIGIGGGGKYNTAKSTINAGHDTTNTSPGNNPLGTEVTEGSTSGSWASSYLASEIFNGSADGTSDLGKAQGFATFDASYDWQINDTFVVGLIGNYDVGGKSKMNGQAFGTGSAGWTEAYLYNTYSYTPSGSGGCTSESACISTTSPTVNHALNNGVGVSTTGMSSSFESELKSF